MESTAAQDTAAEARKFIDSATPDERPEDDGGKAGLYSYTSWLHIGNGAPSCPGVKRADDDDTKILKVECSDPDHVHVWIRLPNQFQQNLVREKALAARARRIRVLRDTGDPETGREPSDSRVIMDEELDQLRQSAVVGGGEAVRTLTEELVNNEWFRDQLEAVGTVQENDEKYEHIEADRARMRELEGEFAAGPGDAEPTEELVHLRLFFEEYAKEVEAALHKIQQPKFEALADKTPEQLIDMVREQRITEDAESEFQHTAAFWTWFYGTYTSDVTDDGYHPTRRYGTIERLKEEDEFVITSLQAAFMTMETAKNRRAAGNS